MFNRKKIAELQSELAELNNIFHSFKQESLKESKRLSFLLENPLLFKVGDKPFKDIVITKINHSYNVIGYGGIYGSPIFGWEWLIESFDTKNKVVVFLKLDCGNKLINPNK
jgi:hypothetical protein